MKPVGRHIAGETLYPDVLDALEQGSDEHGRRYYASYNVVLYQETLKGCPSS